MADLHTNICEGCSAKIDEAEAICGACLQIINETMDKRERDCKDGHLSAENVGITNGTLVMTCYHCGHVWWPEMTKTAQ